jgi:hypothetical protein
MEIRFKVVLTIVYPNGGTSMLYHIDGGAPRWSDSEGVVRLEGVEVVKRN